MQGSTNIGMKDSAQMEYNPDVETNNEVQSDWTLNGIVTEFVDTTTMHYFPQMLPTPLWAFRIIFALVGFTFLLISFIHGHSMVVKYARYPVKVSCIICMPSESEIHPLSNSQNRVNILLSFVVEVD